MSKKIKPWKELPGGFERDWVAGYICPDCKREVYMAGNSEYTFCPFCGKQRIEEDD